VFPSIAHPPTPLYVGAPALPNWEALDWAVWKVKRFHHFVGLSYEGFEDEVMALFSAIEASRDHNSRLVFLVVFLSQ
jgi:hypothetical protein